MADLRTWSKELIVELLLMYQSFPCLWKIKSEEYKNKNLKEEAYKKIVDFVKERGFLNANRDFVVKKLQSLRGSFRKELKKVVDSQRSGRGTDDVYKSTLWYFDNLLFTKDQELPANSISNIDEELEDESRTNDYFYQNDISTDESVTESGAGETGQQTKVTDAAPTAMASTPRNKRKATTNYQAKFYKICTDTLKSTSKELSEFDVTGINIGKKLAKMDPLQAIYAESIINNVIRKGLLKNLSVATDVCDNYCNKKLIIHAPSSVELSSS
ncbi:uncharacterized protein LOC143910449 [Arctopsyche grandis]|uniref:uncharacterized protein LOC143910449 n=1 Tax=Arctopsyche grandis TaxID=121162 RepID=UPI00406D868B